MDNECRVCNVCKATIPAGVYHACMPKVEENMAEEDLDHATLLRIYNAWPDLTRKLLLVRSASIAGFEAFKYGWKRGSEASRQKMREEMDKLKGELVIKTLENAKGAQVLSDLESGAGGVDGREVMEQKPCRFKVITKQELMNQLSITENQLCTLNHHVTEKLFCAAILDAGTDAAAQILRKYNVLKDILYGS